MLQPSPVPATPLIERLRAAGGRRSLSILLVLLIEGLLLLLLLSFGSERLPGAKDRGITVLNLPADQAPEETSEAAAAEPEQRAEEPSPLPRRPLEQALPPQPTEALPAQPAEPTPAAPVPPALPTPERLPSFQLPPGRAAPPASPPRGPAYGPADPGRSSAFRDSERVGTAPNGEPLYAAAWYREPDPAALGAYLSTAREPGWGLIACRTAPDYRVEDCVPIAEYPQGSQINRAILAAAWEFRVRPPQRGGRPLVGSWVRIRIDYSIGRN